MKKETMIGLGIATVIGGAIIWSANDSNTAFENKVIKATEKALGRLSSDQKNNLKLIIDANLRLNPTDKGSQLAYIIATAWHESRLMPVRECFAKNDTAARECVQSRDYSTVIHGNVYYGRGFVQLTWLDNYRKYTNILGVDLVMNPDLVLVPKTASFILVHGMVNGVFTGKKLSDYITDQGVNDFYTARRIVNKLDRAQLIAEHAIDIINSSNN